MQLIRKSEHVLKCQRKILVQQEKMMNLDMGLFEQTLLYNIVPIYLTLRQEHQSSLLPLQPLFSHLQIHPMNHQLHQLILLLLRHVKRFVQYLKNHILSSFISTVQIPMETPFQRQRHVAGWQKRQSLSKTSFVIVLPLMESTTQLEMSALPPAVDVLVQAPPQTYQVQGHQFLSCHQ